MRIIDDALPAQDFQKLQSTVLDTDFPWLYGRQTRDYEAPENPYLIGWSHYVLPPRKDRSILLDTLPGLLHEMFERVGEPVRGLNRARIILNTTAPSPWLNGVHTDFHVPHRTALLYLNDADGDTVIYQEKWSLDHTRDPANLTVLETVEPKANRLVLFDGLHIHTGTLPTKANRRVVLNVNYFA